MSTWQSALAGLAGIAIALIPILILQARQRRIMWEKCWKPELEKSQRFIEYVDILSAREALAHDEKIVFAGGQIIHYGTCMNCLKPWPCEEAEEQR